MNRATLAALILLLLVGGLYWYSNQDGNVLSVAISGTPTPTNAPPGYLVEPYTKTVSEVNIRKADGLSLNLKIRNGQWTGSDSTSSLGDLDQTAIESAVLGIQNLHILTTIETPSDLGDYGLNAENAAYIDILFSDGSSLQLRVGKLTPTGAGYYLLDKNQPNQVLILAKLGIDTLIDLPGNPPIIPVDILESTPTP